MTYSHSNPGIGGQELLISPSPRGGNLGPERLSSLPKVTKTLLLLHEALPTHFTTMTMKCPVIGLVFEAELAMVGIIKLEIL